MTAQPSLADRIRGEASVADRPGQMARLDAIADDVERLAADLATAQHMADAYRRSRDEHKKHQLAAEAEVDRLRARFDMPEAQVPDREPDKWVDLGGLQVPVWVDNS